MNVCTSPEQSTQMQQTQHSFRDRPRVVLLSLARKSLLNSKSRLFIDAAFVLADVVHLFMLRGEWIQDEDAFIVSLITLRHVCIRQYRYSIQSTEAEMAHT